MVFWLGWTKKLKEAVSEKFVKKNYLNKVQREELQTVQSLVDFHNNIVAKREAFVDVVGNGDTNIPNLRYLKQKDTFGIIRFWLSDINSGRWRIDWIKKPSYWMDNWIVANVIHINTTYIENNIIKFCANPNGRETYSFQEHLNLTLPNTAISNQFNNDIFKDQRKPVFIYLYLVLNEKLGGRTLKVSVPCFSGYDKTNWEITIPVNMNI